MRDLLKRLNFIFLKPKPKHPLILKWENHMEAWSDEAMQKRVNRDVELFLLENNMEEERDEFLKKINNYGK